MLPMIIENDQKHIFHFEIRNGQNLNFQNYNGQISIFMYNYLPESNTCDQMIMKLILMLSNSLYLSKMNPLSMLL